MAALYSEADGKLDELRADGSNKKGHGRDQRQETSSDGSSLVASLTLEYMPKGDLHKYLTAHPKQTAQQRVLWCAQATEGLIHMHRHKVIHSDVRTDNMLVADDLSLRLIDFGGSGIDKGPSLGAEATRYFLPRMDWQTTPETDRFALGSSFYYIMTGRAPYEELSDADADAQLAKKVWPSDVHDLVIGKVIAKCWECQYKTTHDIYMDLYNLRDAVSAIDKE